VGLLLHGLASYKNNEENRQQSNSFSDVLAMMKSWFQNNF